MKFACLGYYDEKAFLAKPQAEQDRLVAECFAYDAVLRKGGHYVDGLALQAATCTKTVRWGNGKLVVTDGPFVETKEVLGGVLILEARDLDHVLELMSKHPGAQFGPWEIRPVDEEMTARDRGAA